MQTVTPPSVLFIDDDQGICDAFELFFEDAGWKYTIAPDGITGLEYALNNKYDIIITDLIIPGLSGLDLVKEVHKYKPGQVMLVVSGSGMVDTAMSAIREGAVDFIKKPIDFGNLRSTVYRITSGLREENLEHKMYGSLSAQHAEYELIAQDFFTGTPALPILADLVRANLIDTGERLRLTLAYQEAVTNAVDHGNLELSSTLKDNISINGIDSYQLTRRSRMEDPIYGGRKIWITTDYREGCLKITIRDQGKGFVLPRQHEIESKGASLNCYGRGMTIISGAMDEVEYRLNGTEIVMTKKITRC